MMQRRIGRRMVLAGLLGAGLFFSLATDCRADNVIADDQIVQGSLAVGLDSVNNENFGFDTIRLKENNLRIHFDDTSVGNFPANDWRIIINDSAGGGASFFAIEDSTGARTPFKITAGAATNSFFMDSTGRVGLRTATPVLDLHVNTGNSPAFRLEQNASSGFTAQTWDIAGNEANFFIRDVTGGSRLSLRIRPGAPTSSLDIAASGDVGIGTASPQQKLHVNDSAGPATVRLQEATASAQIWDLEGGALGFSLKDITGVTTPLVVLPDAPTNSFLMDTTGNIGLGTAAANTVVATATTGRLLNLRSDGAAGVAKIVAQGTLGGQLFLTHLGGAVDQKVMRVQCSGNHVTFSSISDNLANNVAANALAIQMSTGNVGLKVLSPVHPLQLVSGAHCTAGGVWTNASSRELKRDIRPLTSEQAAAAVQSLKPVGYRYHSELDETYVGFIAEDVPDLVATKDRKSLSPMDITAVLTKVVQDQQSQLQAAQNALRDQEKLVQEQRRLLDEQRALLTSLAKRLETVERSGRGNPSEEN